mmetsp:Transcript_20524/g.56981  ORF Transcript_20524/g.56981 Transcript_20524/m.56981 type:complete len:203 (+) Transcript_20524:737-1345(+)
MHLVRNSVAHGGEAPCRRGGDAQTEPHRGCCEKKQCRGDAQTSRRGVRGGHADALLKEARVEGAQRLRRRAMHLQKRSSGRAQPFRRAGVIHLRLPEANRKWGCAIGRQKCCRWDVFAGPIIEFIPIFPIFWLSMASCRIPRPPQVTGIHRPPQLEDGVDAERNVAVASGPEPHDLGLPLTTSRSPRAIPSPVDLVDVPWPA